MPRIFKGIESELRLLLHPCILTGEITDIKVALFTNDPSVAIEFTDRYTIDDNILTLKVPTWAFGTMEDGVINYVIQGMHNDDAFITDRQSNYYLKTPTDYIPEEMPEEVVLGELTRMIVENGVFEYTPTDVDAWNKATIEVNVPDTNGSYDEGYNVGKNDGYDSGYQDGYNAGQPIKYNTISDIYGSPSDSIVQFKGLVALSFAYGSGNFILFTDHTGSILLRNHKEPLMVGDECVVTATLRRTDSSYISVLFTASVEVLSSNNYVVMPAEAVELTNVDELYMPNENGYAEMKYLYVDGTVGDNITENFIRLETDASSQGNIGLRGDFKDWVEKLKQGDSIRVYMFTENSTNNFDVKDIVQLGTEGGSCNLGEGEILLNTSMAGTYELYASDDGYDGWSKFYVTLENGGAIKIHKAEELIQMFNEGWGIDFGTYYYVGGKITEIQEINVEFGNATYVLDNGFKVYRGDWIDGNPFGEDQIKVGAYIVVYGIIQDYKGELQLKAHSQVIAYQECEGGEIVSCNLEDKWVTPSMGDRDDNGFVVVEESEGFDGLARVVIDPTTIYNEGVTAGKAEGSGLNIGAVSTFLGVGNWNSWTRTAPQFGLDGITEITIDGRDYQEWTKGRTLLEAYNTADEIHITENGEYLPVMGYDGFAIRGYNVGWVTDVIPTIDTDVEIWVKPYDGAPNIWQGFIGSQVSDDDNTTFQIRKMDGNNAFCFKFGEQTFDYEFEYERWYRLRMNRRGVWVNGEQVCGWNVRAFEENPNPLMINGIYNLGFEGENYRMNYAAYGYIYFHNSDSLLVPNRNGSFIGDKNRITQRQRTSDATLSGERNFYPNGYTKVTVDVPQNGGGGEENNCELIDVNINGNGFYTTENFLPTIPMISTYGEYGVDSTGWFDLGQKMEHGDTIEIYFTFSIGDSVDQLPTLFGCEESDWDTSTLAVRQYAGILECKIGVETVRIDVDNEFNRAHKLTINTSEGVWFDDELVVSNDFRRTWQPTDANMYAGAMNNLGEGIWRPWNSRIGNILIRKADGTEHHYEVKDGGEYRYVEGDYVIPNLKGEGVSYTAEIPYGKPADGFNSVWVEIDGEGYREEGRNDVRDKLQSIEITENGRYSIDDTELVNSITFDGNSYFDTGIVPTEDIKIEVCIKVTDGNDSGMGGIIIGGGIDPVDSANYNGTENRGIAIGMGSGAIYGVWGATKSWNNPYEYERTTTVVLQKTDDSWGWEGEKGSFGASTLYIGGYNRNGEEVEEKFTQSIVYVKIWTDGNDDSTLVTFIPKNMSQGAFGMVNSEGTEHNYVENLGEGTTTFISEWERKYGEGWREINVNIPTIQNTLKDYYYCPLILGDTGFGEAAKSWNANMVTLNNYDGNVIEDKLYVPTSNNKNEFRTKEKARFVQRLPNDVSIFGSMEFGDGVEYFVTNEGKQFTNLTDLTIGPDMNTVKFGPSTFPTLKRIWCFSETDSIDVYFSMGSYFYDSGTLYLKNHSQETEWKTSLPIGWTIVLL